MRTAARVDINNIVMFPHSNNGRCMILGTVGRLQGMVGAHVGLGGGWTIAGARAVLWP